MPTFGKRLNAAMQAGGYSASKLAEEIGVARQVVNRWLKLREPALSAMNLIDCAKTLKVRVLWLGTGEGPVHSFMAKEYTASELLQAFGTLCQKDKALVRDFVGLVMKRRDD